MDRALFSKPAGEIIACRPATPGGAYLAFVPGNLPPADELAAISGSAGLLASAAHAVGQLAGVGHFMPNPNLVVEPYLRREAVLSSRIEGYQTTHVELAEREALGSLSRSDEARDVHNYVVALDHGFRGVADGGVTRSLIQELHRKLMEGARGERFSTPGEFRSIQNHIGNSRDHASARFVPPPPQEMHQALDELILYARETRGPALVAAAWLHYQFETIHPFLDGNGRVGRALIPLFLAARQQLDRPLLFMSPFFERNRSEYYDRLFAVSARSEWAGWLEFFLRGILEQATEATTFSRDLVALSATWRERLAAARASANAHKLTELALSFVAIDAKSAGRYLGVSSQTAYKSIETLVRAGILEDVTGRPWGRLFLSPEVRELLDADH
jgi:Fic family protein